MATQTVVYTAQDKLSCAGCQPAEVILCVDPTLVAPKNCNLLQTQTTYPFSTIPGQLVQTREFVKCGQKFFEYTFAYDDADLIPPNLLTCQDISGVICEGCLTTFIKDIAGNEVFIQTGQNGQELVTQHGCIYPINASGYEWTFSADSGPVQNVQNTDNVEYIGGASIATTSAPGDQLTIDLELSTDTPNIAVFGTDGNLFVEGPAFAAPTPYFIGL